MHMIFSKHTFDFFGSLHITFGDNVSTQWVRSASTSPFVSGIKSSETNNLLKKKFLRNEISSREWQVDFVYVPCIIKNISPTSETWILGVYIINIIIQLFLLLLLSLLQLLSQLLILL